MLHERSMNECLLTASGKFSTIGVCLIDGLPHHNPLLIRLVTDDNQ
jgi:hypothetical protein